MEATLDWPVRTVGYAGLLGGPSRLTRLNKGCPFSLSLSRRRGGEGAPLHQQGKMLPSFEDFGNAATFCIFSRILLSLSLSFPCFLLLGHFTIVSNILSCF